MTDDVRRILVVDDDAITRAMLADCLERAGYKVIEAASGMDALVAVRTAFVKGKPFHLLLLDLNMPGMSGIEFLQTFRGREWGVALPVLILSARGDRDAVLACRAYGVSGYLVKPFDPKKVRDRIAEVFREEEEQKEVAHRRTIETLDEEEGEDEGDEAAG